jgi:UDP-perosamine 4-acetyltransferase
MDPLELPVIVIGGGGHAKVVISTLLQYRGSILGFVDLNPTCPSLFGVGNLGNDAAVLLYAPADVQLVNGVGSTASTANRQDVYDRFTRKGYCFATVKHPSAIIPAEVQIEPGAQIMAGVILQPGSTIGPNAIVNTGAIIDHDCIIGAHAHVAPGVTLSGGVHIGAGAHVGTGASIIQRIQVGAGSVVGAGALVIRDVPPGAKVVGVPATPISDKRTAR